MDNVSIFDIIGNIVNKSDNITDKNVNIAPYTKFDLDNIFKGEIELTDSKEFFGPTPPEQYSLKFISVKKEHYTSTGVAVLIYKNNVPIILTTFNGDERGYTFFNDTFIISGHDGSYLYNLNNHHEFKSM